jgi:hypothetical protein
MNYFAGCYTIHDAKKKFRELSHIHHPDKGGDSKVMAELIRQYDAFIPSAPPHSNPYRAKGNAYSSSSNAYMHESNNPFSNQSFFDRAKREGFQSASGVPWDHPLYVELRELRSKFNYAMDEENKFLKKENESYQRKRVIWVEETEMLREKIKKYQKIIKDLKAIGKEAKPTPRRVRKKKSAES